MKATLLALVLAFGCTKAPPNEAPTQPGPEPGLARKPPPPPVVKATVTLTSVTLADDCGDAAPMTPPAPMKRRPASDTPAPASVVPESTRPGAQQEPLARRRCEQTAMQLVVDAKEATEIQIKTVEIFDDAGKLLGKVDAKKPMQWKDTAYVDWDGKVTAAQNVQVSYVLSQPTFIDRYASQDRTFTIKVIASVGGVDQPLQATAMVVGIPAPVPT